MHIALIDTPHLNPPDLFWIKIHALSPEKFTKNVKNHPQSHNVKENED